MQIQLTNQKYYDVVRFLEERSCNTEREDNYVIYELNTGGRVKLNTEKELVLKDLNDQTKRDLLSILN
ncbi:MAG: hypothetical protein KKF48_03620 [Nanoarchaeota archaeon]|nr:hypothetical protein [Nanoarchaeota archaeon]MBU1028108.1 hypothetical protein [Nanoarchaeota archaeon]